MTEIPLIAQPLVVGRPMFNGDAVVRQPGRVATGQVQGKGYQRVASTNASIGYATRLTRGSEELAKPQLDARTSLVSVRLSSRPIAVLEAVDGPINGNIYILLTGHRDITVGSDQGCDLP